MKKNICTSDTELEMINKYNEVQLFNCMHAFFFYIFLCRYLTTPPRKLWPNPILEDHSFEKLEFTFLEDAFTKIQL